MKETLAKIEVSKTSKTAHLGSLVITDKANYYLSISAGQLVVGEDNYFAISTDSPIGKLLLGKQQNDRIVWNGTVIRIVEIA